ncbi:MAG: hypothetical protein KAG37_09425, partial [Flavobacteriales bacterium]|nr:hypothetical protein [Flavobacteriales bacterium]
LTSSVNIFGSITVPARVIDATSDNLTDNDFNVYVRNPNNTRIGPATVTLQMPDAVAAKGRMYNVTRELDVTLVLVNNTPVVFDDNGSLYTTIYSDGIEWFANSVVTSNDGINPGYLLKIDSVDITITIPEEITVSPDIQLYHVKGDSQNKDVIVNLPNAGEVAGIVYTITLLEGIGNSGGGATFITVDGDKVNNQESGASVKGVIYVFIYSDGYNWWAFGNSGDTAGKAVVSEFSGEAQLETNSDIHTFEANFTENNQSYTLTLPSVVDNKGTRITIKRNADGVVNSGNVLYVKPADTESIDDIPSSSSYVMNVNFESVTVESNGVIWMIVNQVKH